MSGPFTSPVAYSIPFNAEDPAAIAAGIESDNVFDAIIEAKQDSINNDRYPIDCSYNGNANTNRRLEIFPGIDSSTAPFITPENTKIVAYTFGAIANSTGVIAIKNISTNTDLVLATFVNQSRIVVYGVNIFGISSSNELEIYIKSGSFSKPFGRVWLNTIT